MLAFLLSLVWAWNTAVFQLSGFYCISESISPKSSQLPVALGFRSGACSSSGQERRGSLAAEVVPEGSGVLPRGPCGAVEMDIEMITYAYIYIYT